MKFLPNYIKASLEKVKLSFESLLSSLYSPKDPIFSKKDIYIFGLLLDIVCLSLIFISGIQPVQKIISPIRNDMHPVTANKSNYEIFGFAPYWNINNGKMQNVDFDTLTTFAYFGIELSGNGTFIQDDAGYQTFKNPSTVKLFKKAHASGTRVVITITQMNNFEIERLMDNPNAQEKAISEITTLVMRTGIDGVNIDMEYMGDPGQEYRNKFTQFINNLTHKMHDLLPESKVSVSVYASAIKDPKIYDIKSLGKIVDNIFMMAYDYAVASSDNAIPTAPLYGHKSGKYWYDVSTAVEDFLAFMPSNKLILGVPYYGYNWLVYNPAVKAETRPYYSWRGTPTAQTYEYVKNNVKADKEGWDEEGKVGWKAYYVAATDTWRMVFLDDSRSLSLKYDFAKSKNLAGVGMWALGNDNGADELWVLLRRKFGSKIAGSFVAGKDIN